MPFRNIRIIKKLNSMFIFLSIKTNNNAWVNKCYYINIHCASHYLLKPLNNYNNTTNVLLNLCVEMVINS